MYINTYDQSTVIDSVVLILLITYYLSEYYIGDREEYVNKNTDFTSFLSTKLIDKDLLLRVSLLITPTHTCMHAKIITHYFVVLFAHGVLVSYWALLQSQKGLIVARNTGRH